MAEEEKKAVELGDQNLDDVAGGIQEIGLDAGLSGLAEVAESVSAGAVHAIDDVLSGIGIDANGSDHVAELLVHTVVKH